MKLFHGAALSVAVFLILIPPGLAVSVRRLHDFNQPGWWMLLIFVPFGALILTAMACIPGTEEENDYDRTGW